MKPVVYHYEGEKVSILVLMDLCIKTIERQPDDATIEWFQSLF